LRPAPRAWRNPPREWKARASSLPLEHVDEFAVAIHNLIHRVLTRDLLRAPGYQRVPKTRTADCEADESGHAGRRLQPFMNFVVVLAAPEDDASHFVAAIPPG